MKRFEASYYSGGKALVFGEHYNRFLLTQIGKLQFGLLGTTFVKELVEVLLTQE